MQGDVDGNGSFMNDKILSEQASDDGDQNDNIYSATTSDDDDFFHNDVNEDYDYGSASIQEVRGNNDDNRNGKVRQEGRDLCTECSRINLKDLISEKTIEHHLTFRSLLECSRTCDLCLFLLECMTRLGDDIPVDAPIQLTYRAENDTAKLRIIHLGKLGSVLNELDASIEILGPSKTSELHAVGSYQLYPAHLQSRYDEIVDKVGNHVSYHQGSSTQEAPALPTRVIDVGPPDGSVEPCLRESKFWDPFLQESKQRYGKWIALSYCWGKLPFISTTTSNLNRRRDGVPLRLLPRTFQDAVRLTRLLNIRYLWIDSLCIIQNSLSDWQTEVMAMPYVYSKSYLTISASASGTPHGGIFRGPGNEYKITLAEDSVLSIRKVAGSQDFTRHRAWCLQEEVLSHQLLRFTQFSINYRVARGILKPLASPADLQSESDYFHSIIQQSSISKQDEKDYSRSIALKIAREWRNVLSDYVNRNLTFSTDKLPAISGIARYIVAQNPADRYLAGLFLGHLPQFLLWKATIRAKPVSKYRAPSWSWASTDSVVSFRHCVGDGMTDDFGCQILGATTAAIGTDLYGQISYGSLKIHGYVLPAFVSVEGDISNGVEEVKELEEKLAKESREFKNLEKDVALYKDYHAHGEEDSGLLKSKKEAENEANNLTTTKRHFWGLFSKNRGRLSRLGSQYLQAEIKQLEEPIQRQKSTEKLQRDYASAKERVESAERILKEKVSEYKEAAFLLPSPHFCLSQDIPLQGWHAFAVFRKDDSNTIPPGSEVLCLQLNNDKGLVLMADGHEKEIVYRRLGIYVRHKLLSTAGMIYDTQNLHKSLFVEKTITIV